jgi:hypothetical protein
MDNGTTHPENVTDSIKIVQGSQLIFSLTPSLSRKGRGEDEKYARGETKEAEVDSTTLI